MGCALAAEHCLHLCRMFWTSQGMSQVGLWKRVHTLTDLESAVRYHLMRQSESTSNRAVQAEGCAARRSAHLDRTPAGVAIYNPAFAGDIVDLGAQSQ
mgnify:CR=1 FL=1